MQMFVKTTRFFAVSVKPIFFCLLPFSSEFFDILTDMRSTLFCTYFLKQIMQNFVTVFVLIEQKDCTNAHCLKIFAWLFEQCTTKLPKTAALLDAHGLPGAKTSHVHCSPRLCKGNSP
jgi:hypothetical protein